MNPRDSTWTQTAQKRAIGHGARQEPSVDVSARQGVDGFTTNLVKVKIVCKECGILDRLQLPVWLAATSALRGCVHDAIPDSHQKLKKLLGDRRTGFNVYSTTCCYELAEVEYEKSSKECEGLIKVEIF